MLLGHQCGENMFILFSQLTVIANLNLFQVGAADTRPLATHHCKSLRLWFKGGIVPTTV